MAIKVDILQGGINNHGVTVDDFNAFQTDFLTDGIVGAVTATTGGFAVVQKDAGSMTVSVLGGVAYVTGTPTDGTSQRLRVYQDATSDLVIASNTSGATKYDHVYIKLDPTKMKNPNANSDDVASIFVSRSTLSTSDNGTPPTYGYKIAVITVANGASSILTASISSSRSQTYPTPATYLSTPDISWHEVGAVGEPAFQNGWVNYGAAYATAAFRKDAMGFIHLRGLICSGTNAATAFTLPVGYRPSGTEIFSVVSNQVGVSRVDVASDGSVVLNGNNVFESISGITFRAV